MRRGNVHVCARVSACGSAREKQRQMAQSCPRRSQRELCHPLEETQAWIWAERDVVSTRLLLAAFRETLARAQPGRRRGRPGKGSRRAACCLLAGTSLLRKGSGPRGVCQAGNAALRLLRSLVQGRAWGLRSTTSRYPHPRDSGMTQVLKTCQRSS